MAEVVEGESMAKLIDEVYRKFKDMLNPNLALLFNEFRTIDKRNFIVIASICHEYFEPKLLMVPQLPDVFVWERKRASNASSSALPKKAEVEQRLMPICVDVAFDVTRVDLRQRVFRFIRSVSEELVPGSIANLAFLFYTAVPRTHDEDLLAMHHCFVAELTAALPVKRSRTLYVELFQHIEQLEPSNDGVGFLKWLCKMVNRWRRCEVRGDPNDRSVSPDRTFAEVKQIRVTRKGSATGNNNDAATETTVKLPEYTKASMDMRMNKEAILASMDEVPTLSSRVLVFDAGTSDSPCLCAKHGDHLEDLLNFHTWILASDIDVDALKEPNESPLFKHVMADVLGARKEDGGIVAPISFGAYFVEINRLCVNLVCERAVVGKALSSWAVNFISVVAEACRIIDYADKPVRDRFELPSGKEYCKLLGNLIMAKCGGDLRKALSAACFRVPAWVSVCILHHWMVLQGTVKPEAGIAFATMLEASKLILKTEEEPEQVRPKRKRPNNTDDHSSPSDDDVRAILRTENSWKWRSCIWSRATASLLMAKPEMSFMIQNCASLVVGTAVKEDFDDVSPADAHRGAVRYYSIILDEVQAFTLLCRVVPTVVTFETELLGQVSKDTKLLELICGALPIEDSERFVDSDSEQEG